MNNIYKSLTILLLSAVNLSAFAKDLPVNMHEGKSSEQPKGMSMGMSEEMKNKKAQKKQIYILKINDLSDRIQDEKNANMKQKLMDEQLLLIRAHQDKKRMMMKKMMMKKKKSMGM